MDPVPKKIDDLKDDIAKMTAMIDQAQTTLDRNRHLLTEEQIDQQEELLDLYEGQIEMYKLLVDLSRRFKEESDK